ncbi:uncharacterized protein LOC134220135 [Armigeres subalbatus]|uniref:uncharacterized protein LOC134220135 n=1 Tax=Armigeres subalbatus TaxID=124917 RepID=UPI002ED39179
MIRMKTLLVVWLACAVADYVEEREFIPSASMDTEDGWRVMQSPLTKFEETPGSETQMYTSFPKLERLSNEIGKDFLNDDEEFRIHVVDGKHGEKNASPREGDNLPVASSLVGAMPSKHEKESVVPPLRIVKPPKSFNENMLRKPTQFANNEIYAPYLPKKIVREPLMDRLPYYDMVPENTYQSLSHLEDSFYLPSYDHQSTPQFLPYRNHPALDNSIEYYEVDKYAPPIILKEEISYEGMPFVPHRFPPMPQKMSFPGGGMFPKPYFKGPPLPISVKARKIVRKPKRMVSFGRSSRGIPIVRGRFRV